MEDLKRINACAFVIRDEAGTLLEAGIVAFKKLHAAVQFELKTFKKEAAEKMVRTCPPGGYKIIDAFTNGRIEILTVEMDDDIPYSAITSAIDFLREKFDVPVIEVPKTKTIAITPNPARS